MRVPWMAWRQCSQALKSLCSRFFTKPSAGKVMFCNPTLTSPGQKKRRSQPLSPSAPFLRTWAVRLTLMFDLHVLICPWRWASPTWQNQNETLACRAHLNQNLRCSGHPLGHILYRCSDTCPAETLGEILTLMNSMKDLPLSCIQPRFLPLPFMSFE